MNDERLMNIIVSPRVSEKATIKADSENQHVFSVLKDANKLEVKEAVDILKVRKEINKGNRQDGIQKLQVVMQLLKVMLLWIKMQLYQSLKFSSSIYTKN